MSGAPSEPEKYSIDEIMDRLKAAPSENPADGELVTRSDGSQAIRVRKRKRRSSQPHKNKTERTRRSRIIQVAAALMLVFLAALAVGAAMVYGNSSPFRQGLLQKIGQATGAAAELYQFRMNPKTANANNLMLEWPEGNVLKSLTTQGLNGEVFPATFLGKAMTGEEIRIAEATLALQIPKAGAPARNVPAAEGALPIRFNRYRTSAFNATLGAAESPILRLYKSQASLASETLAGHPQLRLYRGDLAVAGWPNLRLNRALIQFRDTEIDFINSQIFHPVDERGSLSLTGTISPYKPDQVSNLTVSLDSFMIDGVTGPQLGRLITGRIDSVSAAKSNYFSFQPTEESSPVMDVSFTVNPTSVIEFQGFPFLLGISQAMDGDEWFEKPVFDTDATGIIHREKGVISFRDLKFISKARMAIHGDISMMPGGSLSGKLEVGLPDAMIAKNSPLRRMIGAQKDGFRWMTLEIGGAVTSPTDNFKELLTQTSTVKEPAPAPPDREGSSFEELTRPRAPK